MKRFFHYQRLTLGLLMVLSLLPSVATAQITQKLNQYRWVLTEIKDGQGKMTVQNEDAYLMFDRIQRSIGGNSACNSFGGSVRVKGKRVTIGPIVSTKMFCVETADLEMRFLNALQSPLIYQLQGTKLIFTNPKNGHRLTFTQRPKGIK